MSTSEEFQERRSDRKRKREVNEESITTMETEKSPTPLFPQMNVAQLEVSITLLRPEMKHFSLSLRRSKPMAFERCPFRLIATLR